MPTYEYACQSCGRRVEVFQRFADDPLTACEECGGPLRKVFHPAGIMFKGSGFYATDSRRGSKSSSDATGKESKPADDTKKKDMAKESGPAGGSGGGSGSGSGGSAGGSGGSTDKTPKEKSA